MKTIRCSSLPSFEDCSRRTVARGYADILAAHKFQRNANLPSIGAAIGTAVHSAAGHFLIARLNGETEPSQAACVEIAEAKLITQVRPGAIWDATSGNIKIATAQVVKMIAAYWPELIKKKPLIVESELRAMIAPGWVLSGHVDCFEENGELDDLKTGVPSRNHVTQLGGYALNLEANGHKLRSATVTFIKRVAYTKPQPAPVKTQYSLGESKLSAWSTIQEIVKSVDSFEATGNPYDIRANPMSLMCSEKYCPVYRTPFCKLHNHEEENNEEIIADS